MKKKGLLLFGFFCLILVAIMAGVIAGYREIHFSVDGKTVLNVDVGSKYNAPEVNACYGNFFHCKALKVDKIGDVDTNRIGTYHVFYQVKKDGKTKKLAIKVVVEDRKKPELVVEGEKLQVCPNGKLKQYQYRAIDQYDGDLTSKVKIEEKEGNLVFSVRASSGNETLKKVPYEKVDQVPPSLTYKGNPTMSLLVGSTYRDPGMNAMDDCDGDLTPNIVVSGNVNTKVPGTYKVIYTATDQSGNQTSAARTVKVYKKNVTTIPGKKTIYLTFDDGPGPHTARLLDILAKYNVKATFFVTGVNPAYDPMITRAYKEGHSIGLHTYTHRYQTVYASKEAYYQDLNLISNKVKNLTGVETKLIRFPGGSSNTVSNRVPGLMTYLARDVEARGYKYFDWNITSGDAGETTSTQVVANNVIRNLRNDYSIVLQHDSQGFSVNAVETIIQYGLSHGYTFAPLTMSSPTAHHKINN